MARTKAMNVIKDLPFDEQAKVIDRTIQSRWAGLFINGKNEENKRVNESSHARVMQRLSDEIANE